MTDTKTPYKGLIITLSIVIPIAIAVLFKVRVSGYNFSFLPPIYATLNGLTAVCLVSAVVAIKRGNRKVHERLMKLCMVLSSLFLVMYVLYHMTSDPTHFGGVGLAKVVYLVILISHIILSVLVIPMVLFTFVYGLGGNFERHRALAKFTFPIWLYVAVTGVIVYLMISPYYAHG